MEETLIEIKKLFDQGLGSRKIAEQLGMTRYAVQQAYKELDIYDIGRTKPKTAYLAIEKICKKCQLTKSIKQFRQRIKKDRISYEVYCLTCEKEYNITSCKERYQHHKDGRVKEYRNNNLDKILKYNRQYNKNNSEKIKLYKKSSKWKNYINNYVKNKRINNEEFKLRLYLSNSINIRLKNNGGSKLGQSYLKYLPYSIQDLKQHIESKFEPWMTWQNHGRYVSKTWDDQNSSTWTWQIDHIVPASLLPYSSMEEENFKKCWSLENLRPLNAKQNVIDGTKRIRHKG